MELAQKFSDWCARDSAEFDKEIIADAFGEKDEMDIPVIIQDSLRAELQRIMAAAKREPPDDSEKEPSDDGLPTTLA